VIATAVALPRNSTIVFDASVVVEMLLNSNAGKHAMARLIAADAELHAPELLDVEVLHVLRHLVRQGAMTEPRADEARVLLDALPLTRHRHAALTHRCWQLRANLSAYDATYIALAEGLGASLLTRDARLARTLGVATPIEVV
jgi:predicted nucleic acid-binding protein